MACRVTDLMFVVDPSTPISMHLTCGPLLVDTQCPAVSGKPDPHREPVRLRPLDSRRSNIEPTCGPSSCAYDSTLPA
jgi:hypothetical protein